MRPFIVFRVLCALVALVVIDPLSAQSTFRISQVFSNLDGSVQYIALTETAGLDEQHHFKGLKLRIAHGEIAKEFTFYDDLATAKTAYRSFIVATAPGERIVEVTGNFSHFARPDFFAPARFIPVGGGTVTFAGIDTVTYPALPTDGSTAWYRSGNIARGTIPGGYGCGIVPSSGCAGVVRPTATRVSAIEYYNAELDHYSMTASADEIDGLDGGSIRGWERTGASIPIAQVAHTVEDLEYSYDALPVCRLYLPPIRGDSHFFSASAEECAEVRARFPEFIEESAAAFWAARPDTTTGQCGVQVGFVDGDIPLSPIYRLWNQRADTNHRYTSSDQVRASMIARGWLPEGYGPLGVAMCY